MHAAFRKLQGKMRQIFRQIAVWLTSVWAPKLYIPRTINIWLLIWHTKWVSYAKAYFWSKKVHFRTNICTFFTFMSINLLVLTLQSTKNKILYTFCPWKHDKEHPQKKNGRTFQYLPRNKKLQDLFTWDI